MDPGTWPAFVQEQPGEPGGGPADHPEFEPRPSPPFFRAGRRSPITAAMHRRLVAEGCDRYRSSSNIAVWGAADARSYTAWQKKLGYSGSATNGIPGKASWDRLRVPNVWRQTVRSP